MQVENNRALDREKNELEELEQQNQQLHAAKDDIDRKMRDLGALGDAVGEFRGKSLSQLRKTFGKVSKEVEKYGSSVNRKALDELKTFKVKQTQLQKRRTVCAYGCLLLHSSGTPLMSHGWYRTRVSDFEVPRWDCCRS